MNTYKKLNSKVVNLMKNGFTNAIRLMDSWDIFFTISDLEQYIEETVSFLPGLCSGCGVEVVERGDRKRFGGHDWTRSA